MTQRLIERLDRALQQLLEALPDVGANRIAAVRRVGYLQGFEPLKFHS